MSYMEEKGQWKEHRTSKKVSYLYKQVIQNCCKLYTSTTYATVN